VNFWLGVCMVAKLPLVTVPTCVSYGQLRKRSAVPRPGAPVFLDSRGFSEIKQHGCYTFTPQTYAAFVRRLRDEWGELLAHASIMDWMCEPEMLVRTGLSIPIHQANTVRSYLDLVALDSSLPWVPVLQGYSLDDYHRCADLYESAGVNLYALPLVGIGSVCRRQGMKEAAGIIKSLYARGFTNLHGFGFKVTGLVSKGMKLARYLKSSDSMSWSKRARSAYRHERKKLCGGAEQHKGACNNCLTWALAWREHLVCRCERVRRGGTQQFLC
jgi:hypothetical protein